MSLTSRRYTTLALYRIQTQSNGSRSKAILSKANECGREMIFDIPKTISFLSQGTTLERGSIIMTGTGPGIGMARNPKIVLRHGDDMRVYTEGIGTLINEVYYEQ
jgi:2-keto-4-pentenoate hydratase/2-oxohepta-3-ene-1,7-dioic acid hydratase in catechol pathway